MINTFKIPCKKCHWSKVWAFSEEFCSLNTAIKSQIKSFDKLSTDLKSFLKIKVTSVRDIDTLRRIYCLLLL